MRYAHTRKGRLVPLNTLEPVVGGWQGYVLDNRGHAVAVFIPA